MKIYAVQEVKAKHNSYDNDTLLSKKVVKAFIFLIIFKM